jgi:hypothetical protein
MKYFRNSCINILAEFTMPKRGVIDVGGELCSKKLFTREGERFSLLFKLSKVPASSAETFFLTYLRALDLSLRQRYKCCAFINEVRVI